MSVSFGTQPNDFVSHIAVVPASVIRHSLVRNCIIQACPIFFIWEKYFEGGLLVSETITVAADRTTDIVFLRDSLQLEVRFPSNWYSKRLYCIITLN